MTSAIAVKSLKRIPVFRYTSVRLLADLADRARRIRVEDEAEARAAIVVVLDGSARVEKGVSRLRAAQLRLQPSGDEHPERIVRAELIAGDAYVPNVRALRDTPLHLVATSPQGAEVLLLDAKLLRAAARASPSLARTFRVDDPHAALLTFPPDEKRPEPVHLMWLCQDRRLDAPLEALAQLLVASIGQQSGEASGLLNLDDRTLTAWDRATGKFVDVGLELAEAADQKGIVAAILRALARVHAVPYRAHVVAVRPSKANVLTATFKPLSFHHIVYVTPAVPTRIPGELEQQLNPDARNEASPSDPYFTSFIPSIVSPSGGRHAPFAGVSGLSAAAATCARLLGGYFGWPASFRTEDLELYQQTDVNRRARVGWRLARDACRLPFDLADLARRWNVWNTQPAPASFPAVTFTNPSAYQTAAWHWARAVTNRLVGLALSGGGASSYRMIWFIKRLGQLGVPIDVVSGVSGGALLGAYYCEDPVHGLDRCIRHGPFFQLVFFASVISSWVIELALDFTLGGTDVADVEVRFVPVTTALPEGAAPEMQVVTHGTLGQAVRRSGAAPVMVGPAWTGWTRYTDGGSATLLPAGVLQPHGADIVFACNSVPGPAQSNPIGTIPGGRWLRWRTPIGRLLDGWVSGAFFMESVAGQAANDADVFVETHRQRAPLLEQPAFFLARCLAAKSVGDELIEAAAQKCLARWLTP